MRWIVTLALLPVAAVLAQQPAPKPAAPAEPAAPYPRLVTDATRADSLALAALERPGKVLFTDAFESEQSFAAYFEINGQKEGRVTITHEAVNVHSGKGALQLTAPANGGKSCGASPVLWLGDAGHDCVHLRYWIRYAPDYDQGNLNHTGGCLSGVAGTNKWTGMGTAGLRPNGDDHFDSRVEGWRDWQRVASPGFLFCYAYWMDMRRDRDGNYWGNMMGPAEKERFVPARGTWLCVEQRLAANTPGKDDGELAVWLDGTLYLHYTGFRWRSTDAVKIKRMSLMVYVHSATRDNTVFYDDVVVSTGYVGPGEKVKDTK
ncbi:MAG: hypothetical protein Q7T30_02070 [Planctomycetota bacterium]|nr:hypothetical protein [Planctomycetota bacterium]